MSLQDIGSIGELVGAIATVATLFYLAVQIRQNTAQLRESARAAHSTLLDQTVQPFPIHYSIGAVTVQEHVHLYPFRLD